MTNLKRSLAFVMAILITFNTISLSFFTTYAANDKYYTKYGVTYNQLFTLYPQYLSPEAEYLITNTLTEHYCDIIDSYNGGDNFVASYMYSLKNGINILGREVLAGF